MNESREDKAKRLQGYDPSTPRCACCLYFRREPLVKTRTITYPSRSGKRMMTKKEPVRRHPLHNPTVDRCTFGNFEVRPQACCDEWRDVNGDRIAREGE